MQRDSGHIVTQHQRSNVLRCSRVPESADSRSAEGFGGDHQIKLFRQRRFIFDFNHRPTAHFDQRPRDSGPEMPLNCFTLPSPARPPR